MEYIIHYGSNPPELQPIYPRADSIVHSCVNENTNYAKRVRVDERLETTVTSVSNRGKELGGWDLSSRCLTIRKQWENRTKSSTTLREKLR